MLETKVWLVAEAVLSGVFTGHDNVWYGLVSGYGEGGGRKGRIGDLAREAGGRDGADELSMRIPKLPSS